MLTNITYSIKNVSLWAVVTIGFSMTIIAQAFGQSSTSDSNAATTNLGTNENIILGSSNGVGTATSSNLRGEASLQEALGKRNYFESLSAINLQKAIDARLANRKQSIEAYFEARRYHDENVKKSVPVTNEDAIRLAKEGAPPRLTSQDYDSHTGEIYWPHPLDSKVLKPYTDVVNENFVKRSGSERLYTGSDARRVQHIVELIQEAVDVVKKELPVKEYLALSDYLSSLSYEASFDLEGNRVIHK